MDTRYETILDELHVNKRELNNYRQKYLNMESRIIYYQDQLLALQQNHRALKKSLAIAQQNNQKLTEQNKFLTTQKQNLQLQYSTSVESIKDQISKKQQQIYELKCTFRVKIENTFSPLSNQKLVEKQIKCQVQAQFSQMIENKDKRIKQLQQQIQRISFEKQIDTEKYTIKVQSLQKQVKQMQNQHMVHFFMTQIQLQNYAQRTYQNSKLTKVSEQQVLIRKLRRQIDELRTTLDHTQQQLNDSINEKGRIQKQFSSLISKHNQEIQKYAEQLRTLQNQNERHSEIQIKSKKQIDQTVVREKEKQLRNLKDKIQDLHQKLKKKQNKISELEVQLVSKTAELDKVKDFNTKHEHEKIQQLKIEKQRMQRQMKELKYVNDTIRKQNIQLLSTISQTNIKSTKNIMEAERQYQKQILVQKRTKKQTPNILNSGILEDQIDAQQNKSFIQSTQPNGLNRVKSSTNFEKENDSKQKYKFLLEEERYKNQELGRKYVQLKKKYKNLEIKLQQANAKLVNLLKDKIQLGSPTAASKKSFDFPSSPNNAPFFKSPQADRQFNRFAQTVNHSRTNFNNVAGSRNIRFSPENVDQMRKPPRDKSDNQKELSFYEKSLRVRSSHKFKEIKCLNHDDPHHDHQKCDHSPFAK